TQKAARMYGTPAAAPVKPAAKAPPPKSTQSRKSVPSGSHEIGIAAWEDRRAGRFRDDPERRAQVRLEAQQVRAYAVKHGWTPAETQLALSKMSEREAFPRSDEAKQKLRPLTWEQLRIKYGSEEATR